VIVYVSILVSETKAYGIPCVSHMNKGPGLA